MTTTFLAPASALAQFAHGPLAGALDERAVAVGLNALVSRKPDHDDLPGGSQLADRSGEPRIIRIRRTNGGRFRLVRRSAREIAQVHAESGCRPRASECLPDLVVTPAQRDRVRSEEHTSELQSRLHLVCRLLLEKKKNRKIQCACKSTD